MKYIGYFLLQAVCLILIAPLVNGIIKKIKAFTQKRQGPPVYQLYLDLFKLLTKDAVVSETASWIFRGTPYIVLATALSAGFFVPISTAALPGRLPGDLIFVISILALGRFFMMLGALDTGSTFGGMGSSREALISALAEPSLLISLFTVGLIAKSTALPDMMIKMQTVGTPLFQPVYVILAFSVLLVILMETTRIPVDDPATHLELTMVHEAMVLEYSGKYLAFMELGAVVKQLVLITIFVNLFLPFEQFSSTAGLGLILLALLIYLLKVVFMAAVIGLIEVSTVKFRFFSVPNLAAMSLILSFLGFLQYFVLGR